MMSQKNHPHRASGFTLVELLVVIGIIAILAGVVLQGATGALRAAKRAKASSTATQIQTAIMNYYTEYSVYPIVEAATVTADSYYDNADTGDWGKLTEVLCGNIDPLIPNVVIDSSTLNNLNSRQIAYLSPSRSDLYTGGGPGIIKNPFVAATGATPCFFLVMDSDYSSVAGDTGAGSGNMPDFANSTANSSLTMLKNGVTQGVAVWSNCDQTVGAATNPAFWVKTY